tara:strand:- start:1008 stop:1268 length:261 start_codon:yes stop_codon:yes gene_type:complete
MEDKKKEYAEVNYNFNLTESMMEELHMEGKLEVRIEGEEEDMVISFTYNREEEIIKDKSNDEKIISMLDDELDDYINRLTNSIKEL